MSELQELYQEVILDHNKRPRNFGRLEDADCCLQGDNPLCGDRYTIYLKMNGDRIEDVRFEGSGCAISKASASLMTETVKGRTKEEAETLFNHVHHLLTQERAEPFDPLELGKIGALTGVREFPLRVKCATLAWHTLKSALEGNCEDGASVSTE